MSNTAKQYPELHIKYIEGKPVYPGLAKAIYSDSKYGPKIQRRWRRLLFEHQDGLTERGHDWYFGYLVSAYVKTHFGINQLLNFTSVTLELFYLCVNQTETSKED